MLFARELIKNKKIESYFEDIQNLTELLKSLFDDYYDLVTLKKEVAKRKGKIYEDSDSDSDSQY